MKKKYCAIFLFSFFLLISDKTFLLDILTAIHAWFRMTLKRNCFYQGSLRSKSVLSRVSDSIAAYRTRMRLIRYCEQNVDKTWTPYFLTYQHHFY